MKLPYVLFAAIALLPLAQAKDIGFISKDQRAQFISRAKVWSPVAIESMDLAQGPDDKLRPLLQGTVDCDYAPYAPGEAGSGMTPKFKCRLSTGDVIKVKYGKKNSEVYAEVLGTRLLWALGFPTDKVYPVSVRCHNCQKDPWAVYNAAANDTNVDRKLYPEVLFDVATIERKFDGPALETKSDQGFKWEELDQISEANGGATRAQIDALSLLAVFIQHSDSKSANQRLACPKQALTADGTGPVQCSAPMMMIQDLGKTFAGGTGGVFGTVEGVDLKSWQKRPIWKDGDKPAPAGTCVGDLNKGHGGTFGDPAISEGGRQFLASLLARLSTQQLTDLFTVARVTTRDSKHSVQEWVDVFQDKVRQIQQKTCAN